MSNGKKIAAFLLLTLIYLFPAKSYAQEIKLEAENTSLSNILIGLRNSYGVQLSFNNQALSEYYIVADTSFNSAQGVLSYLLKDLPFEYSLSGEVFIIFPVAKQKNENTYLITGHVLDRFSRESLPFSHVSVEGKWIVTNFMGEFSFQTQQEPPYNLKVSYLGYYILDTIVYSGDLIALGLSPSNIAIREILVKGKLVEKSVQSGRTPGEIRINHQIAEFLPGNGDNSVFNLLRLQPGITAAGELSNDLIIWGSYEGQSRVLFDGFTIFGLKNYNENISTVNPFMAKDIRVMKGGYGAAYGERIGGIVDITGVEGARDMPDVKLTVNNLTINGYLSVPLGEQGSFMMAFRQTYYDLYESTSLSILSGRQSPGRFSSRSTAINVYPDYLFRDLNFKISGETTKGDNWFVSLFTGSDRYSYSAESETLMNYIYSAAEEKSLQQGGSLFFGKRWNGGSRSRATLSYSGYFNRSIDQREVTRLISGNTIYSYDNLTETDVGEIDARIEHSIALPGIHSLELGTGVIFDQLSFREDTFGITLSDDISSAPIVNGYFTDIISIGNRLVVKPGVRVDYPVELNRVYLQPRISMTLEASKNLRLNAAAGRYNQFMALSSILDESGNYRYIWTLCDNEDVPVLSSDHFVAGLSFSWNNFQLSAEGYYKTTGGLTRYLNTTFNRFIYYGSSKSRGVDFFVKKDFGNHTFWVSYSLSRTEEKFDYFDTDEYRNALHDQRHEVKLAGIVNFKPFYLSGNWVYGSGFRYPYLSEDIQPAPQPYNRADIAAVYRFSRANYFFDAGLSLLNIFDNENIKYSNLIIIPTSQTDPVDIHAEAVPRTLTIFINFSF